MCFNTDEYREWLENEAREAEREKRWEREDEYINSKEKEDV